MLFTAQNMNRLVKIHWKSWIDINIEFYVLNFLRWHLSQKISFCSIHEFYLIWAIVLYSISLSLLHIEVVKILKDLMGILKSPSIDNLIFYKLSESGLQKSLKWTFFVHLNKKCPREQKVFTKPIFVNLT